MQKGPEYFVEAANMVLQRTRNIRFCFAETGLLLIRGENGLSLALDGKPLLPACGIRYSRVVGSSDSFGLPENPYRWQATCHHNHRLMELGEQFLGLFKKQYLYLMYVWGHSYEFNDKNNWDLMESFCEMMGGKEDIWYCTNIEFMDCYISVNDQPAIRIPGGQGMTL